MRNILVGIRNVLLWSYDRGSWQYDVLCLSIVAAIFLVPGNYFGDRDRGGGRSEFQTDVKVPLASTSDRGGERGFEIVIGASELGEFVRAGRIAPRSIDLPEAILAFIEKDCNCKASLVLPYEVTRRDSGEIAYRVWYRKQ